MLIRHLRLADAGIDATLVAIDRENIGVAICNTKKDHFVKAIGVKIASGRARVNPGLDGINIPSNKRFDVNMILSEAVALMKARAEKYFK